METWFIAALCGAVLAGLSNFMFKVAAKRNFNNETFTFYGGIVSTIYVLVVAFVLGRNLIEIDMLTGLLFVGGIIAATTNIFKVQALRYIDATIYFPLFKILSPAIAIIAGVLLFAETFSPIEWLGMILGLFVPLMLISKHEKLRQEHLIGGLILVVVTAVTSATSAIIFKLGIDGGLDVIIGLFYASVGITVGSIMMSIHKYGIGGLYETVKNNSDKSLIFYTGIRALTITTSFGLILYAYEKGGTLAVVQTINSFYILVPIVLAIIIYKEHWNLQKAIAIILSVAALALLG